MRSKIRVKCLICHSRFTIDARGADPPLSSFSATPVICRAKPSRISQRDLEGGLIVAQPGAVDVGDAIALRIGAAELSARRSDRRRGCRAPTGPAARRSASQSCARREFAPISSPSATRAPDATTAWPISIRRRPAAASGADQFDRVGIDRRRRQAIADDDRKLARAAVHGSPQLGGIRIEHPPEVGPPEIFLPVARPAGDLERRRGRAARVPRSGASTSKAACTASRARA